MRKLSNTEVLTLSGLLKMENDALAIARTTSNLISDDALKQQAEADILAAESRIKGIQQFIQENQVTNTERTE